MDDSNHYPKISVIVPSYNQGPFLEHCLNSIVCQGYPNLELIVIDGGSTDNSREILENFNSYITYWVSKKDKGQSDAVNRGILRSTGDIIGWINSDDIYLDKCLFSASKLFHENPNWDIVFSNYYFVDKESRVIKKRKEIPFDFNIYLWTHDCYHANCAGFFRKRVFDRVGLLNESLNYGMDYEFYLRSYQQGCIIRHSDSYWGAYRLHDNSKSVSSTKHMKNEGLLIAKMFYPQNISGSNILKKQLHYKFLRIIRKVTKFSYMPFIKPKEPLHRGFSFTIYKPNITTNENGGINEKCNCKENQASI